MNIFKKIGQALSPKKSEVKDKTEPTERLSFEEKDGNFVLTFAGRIIFEHNENRPFVEVYRGEIKRDRNEVKKNLRKVIPLIKQTSREVKDGIDIEFNDKGYKLMVFARKKAKTLTITFDGKVNYEYIKFSFYLNKEEIYYGLGRTNDKNLNGKTLDTNGIIKKERENGIFSKKQNSYKSGNGVIYGDKGVVIDIDTEGVEAAFKSAIDLSFYERPQSITFYLGEKEETFRARAAKLSFKQSLKVAFTEGFLQCCTAKEAVRYNNFFKERALPVRGFIITDKITKEELVALKEKLGEVIVIATVKMKMADAATLEKEFSDEVRGLYQTADGFLCEADGIEDIGSASVFFSDCIKLIDRELSEKSVFIKGITQKDSIYPEIAALSAKGDYGAADFYNVNVNRAVSGGVFALEVPFRGWVLNPAANTSFNKALTLAALLPLLVISDIGLSAYRANIDKIKAVLDRRTARNTNILRLLSAVQKGEPQVLTDGACCRIGDATLEYDAMKPMLEDEEY